MPRKKIWLYAVVLFVVAGTILTTQLLWIIQAARLEESFINQRVNQALCSAMDILSKDQGICSSMQTCFKKTPGSFELSLGKPEESKIDSIIAEQLKHYNLDVPFQTSITPYAASGTKKLSHDQALLYPVSNASVQNVLVNLNIPSKNDLVIAQINDTFILSVIMLIVLTVVFISVLKALNKEYTLRKETVDLVNTMAHDLKTPISNISLALSLIEKENKNLNGSQHYFSIINEETGKLKQRAKQILGIATVDAMLEEVSETIELNMHELIHKTIHSFSMRLKQVGGTIQFKTKATAAYIRGNPIQLSTALTNIIDNAIAYTNHSPSIEIATENSGSGISILISDNGPGIPEGKTQLIFKRGYRVHNGHSTVEGLGMGLYLAKSLVEKQRGKLSLISSTENGSTFNIWLPVKS